MILFHPTLTDRRMHIDENRVPPLCIFLILVQIQLLVSYSDISTTRNFVNTYRYQVNRLLVPSGACLLLTSEDKAYGGKRASEVASVSAAENYNVEYYTSLRDQLAAQVHKECGPCPARSHNSRA